MRIVWNRLVVKSRQLEASHSRISEHLRERDYKKSVEIRDN